MNETEKQPSEDEAKTGAEPQAQETGNASEPKSDDDKQPA
jgi:hypothetical protein